MICPWEIFFLQTDFAAGAHNPPLTSRLGERQAGSAPIIQYRFNTLYSNKL